MLIKKNKHEFLSCNLAGFGHTEGYVVLDELKPGDELLMIREDENKHDREAIALFFCPKTECNAELHEIDYKGTRVRALHMGYIPASQNTQLSVFMDYGHEDIFECRIASIDKEDHPNQQIQIKVYLKRK